MVTSDATIQVGCAGEDARVDCQYDGNPETIRNAWNLACLLPNDRGYISVSRYWYTDRYHGYQSFDIYTWTAKMYIYCGFRQNADL